MKNKEIELFPVVGIGASAGGLEAFTQLLSHLPTDTGMAFVLVQHLDPNQKSLLSEILGRVTQMPVHEVQDGMAIEPNQIYVIPPDNIMTISEGLLRLTTRPKIRQAIMSIDKFFLSLAADLGSKAIGVILSGGDADGSLGLEAIKASGGITFAQSEDSAQVSSMPNTAIATGHIDFILPPREIAEKLATISRHPYINNLLTNIPSTKLLDDSDNFSVIFNLLKTTTGLDFSQYKQTTIKRRLLRRMALYRLEQLDDYVRYLQENKKEVQALYQEILISVTNFFRDAHAFEALKEKVFPSLLRGRSPDSPIRIWVAGCSTGEEAYSIAICLLEFLANHPSKPSIQIFATDVNEIAIEKARLGIYQQSQMLDVSPSRQERFFTVVEGGYQINKSVRELCIFARQNLIYDPPFSRLDLITCRNVFIYFGTALQKKVLSMFHYGLMPTGFLLLGTSETVGEFPELFTAIDRKNKIYVKQQNSVWLNLELQQGGYPVETNTVDVNTSPRSINELELQSLADDIILQQYAPVGVVINNQLEIMQFRGQTGLYLDPAPGQASLNLLNMVKEELRMELQTALYQAKQDGQAVKKERIPLREQKSIAAKESTPSRQVQINVIPFKWTATNEDYFLVLFEDESVLPPLKGEVSSISPNRSKRRQLNSEQQKIQQLQQELRSTKAYLQSIISEQQSTNQNLRVANEEILSSNEELQSTNEELQTAKEEIQATNEELSTINDELYRRNSFSTEVSNDLQNLLSNINIPILMLESDLRIRRFTAIAAHLFNLIPTDTGRFFTDIKHNLNIDNLEQHILEVINTLILYNKEVQDVEGHWYDLRIRPYRTLDNRIDGAVVVLVDIDTLKESSDLIKAARDYAEAIVETVRESLLVLNKDLEVVTANQVFYQTFQVSPLETEQCLLFDLGNGQWNIPQLRLLLEEVLVQNTEIQNFAVEHEFEHIGQKTMLVNARIMPPLEGKELILLAFEDISDKSRSQESGVTESE